MSEPWLDGTRITPGTEGCHCDEHGQLCEFPCWQRIGLTAEPCCPGCAPLPKVVADSGLLPLMQFRHEQTIGSEDGYSFREYGRMIDRDYKVVVAAAKGYELLRTSEGLRPIDAWQLARESAPEQTAILATEQITEREICK